MTCQEMVDFLSDYLGNELPNNQQAAFDEHLRVCPPCIDYLESFRETLRLAKSICDDPDGDTPADAPSDLLEAILAARAAR